MILDSLKTYKHTGVQKAKPRYSKGQTVYYASRESGVDPSPLTVEDFRFNSTRGIFQYKTKEHEWYCGEQSLVADVDDEPLRLRDVMWDQKDGIMDEIMASSGKLNGTRDIAYNKFGLEFFQPDREFIDWIAKYAAGRVVIDVGCGTAKLTQRLLDKGVRIIGVDPYFSPESSIKANMKRIANNQNPIHILSKHIEDCGSLFQKQGDKMLLLFARPCHTQFVENALKMKDAETEVLYITKSENLDLYDDLGKFSDRKTLIQHEGWSVEEEVVYSIR